MQIAIPSWKNRRLWAVGMMYILHFLFRPIDLYRASGKSGKLWICSNDFDSIQTIIFQFSKDMGLLLYHSKIKRVTDPKAPLTRQTTDYKHMDW